MALLRRKDRDAGGRSGGSGTAPSPPSPPAQAEYVGPAGLEPALERKYEEAWRRARAADIR